MLTMISVIGLALFGVLVLMDIFSFFIAKRVGPTAADAAALAALTEAERVFNHVATKAVDAEIHELLEQVSDAADKRMEQCLEHEDSESPAPDACDYDDFWRSELRSRVRDPAVEKALLNRESVPLLAAVGEFFTARQRGCLIHQAATEGAIAIRAAAVLFAQENGAVDVQNVQFPYQDQIKVHVVVHAFIPLGLTAHFASATDRLLPIGASSKAAELGLSFDLAGPCGS